ncbi:RNA methyltransferase tRNA(m5U54)methyltransferase [Vermiconidia calcicola]|uniref:RNA methyltransferase tRNA(M5U54)methyltransferase n=1 Tax=Vermiconidia calcicola TaxID=1690605 RepID=A0ACC3MWP4_9PEZI|nr:RNA methyltransferase tRNA(m5U54)methyltransferase [Vermiconidia calcicola]
MATLEAGPVEITAEPKAGQIVQHGDRTFTTIREGCAYILVSPKARTAVDPQAKSKADDGSRAQNVFYNPIQQFNRDLSVLAIKAFGEDVCQRKRQKHEQQSEKNKKKNERKRKRDVNQDEESGKKEKVNERKRKRDADQDEEGGAAKVQKAEDGSAIAVPRDSPESSGAQANPAGTEEHDASSSIAGVSEGPRDGSTAAVPANGSSPTAPSQQDPSLNTGPEPNTSSTQQPSAEDVQSKAEKPWQPRFRILDALSATGLRALRYASEIPFATTVVANDRERNATESIKVNVEHNKLSSSIITTTGDALGHMYGAAYPPPQSHGPSHVSGKYDVIDLDPYGTAAPFIDAALQALEDGGLLCVTCTDSGVFASCGYSEKTFSLYGGMPIKGIHSHEGGLRLILQSIATSAAKYGLAVEPLLSLSIDFYARLFVRVRRSPLDVKFLAGKTMIVYSCDHGCGAWTTQYLGRHMRHKNSDTNWKYSIAQAPGADQLCEHCGSKTHVAGPMWGGPLHNRAFVEMVLKDLETADKEVYQTKARIEGMLDTALDEMTVNSDNMDFRGTTTASADGTKEILPKTPPEALDHHPFFFIPSALCKVIKAQAPPEALLKGALRHAGYRAARSHCKPGSIKTDAPWTAIWEIMREWVRQRSPIKEGALQEIHPGWKILQATRKVDKGGETNGARTAERGEANGEGTTNVEDTEHSTAEGTPDIVTEAPKKSVPPEKPADPKRMEVVFDEKLGKDKPGKRLVRYQENPRENWGPMRKAKGGA